MHRMQLIPSRGYIVGVRRLRARLSGQAKVSNLHALRAGTQQVLGLQVTVKITYDNVIHLNPSHQ